jgi:hypothetical protein
MLAVQSIQKPGISGSDSDEPMAEEDSEHESQGMVS